MGESTGEPETRKAGVTRSAGASVAAPSQRLPRRHDIDWLRIAAVLLLIPYHTARVFDANEDFYVHNAQTSSVLTTLIELMSPWHMALLFVLAGSASWFGLGRRSGGGYLGERWRRLLVPFIFGLIVLVPPQTYLGALSHGVTSDSFAAYFPTFWTTSDADLTGYQGGFTPGHLWFILFLFVYSLVALPLFLRRRRAERPGLLGWFARACRLPGVLVLPAVLLALTIELPVLEVSGQTLVGFFLLFVLGFGLVADDRITAAIDRQWPFLICLGVAALLGEYLIGRLEGDWPDSSWQRFIVGPLLLEVAVWLMIIGLIGLFHRFANRASPLLRYSTEAAYPFYILHQTVLLLVAYWVVQWDASIAVKAPIIALGTLVISLAVYEAGVRRLNPVRTLFGMKARHHSTVKP